MQWISRVVAWLDRLGAWPWLLGAAGVAAGYVTGILTLVAQFPPLLQLSAYLGTAAIAVGVVRSVLRRTARFRPTLVVTAATGMMWWPSDPDRMAYGAWIEVRNYADKPQADALDVFGVLTIHKPDGGTIGPLLARWRDSPYPAAGQGSGNITDRQPIRAGQFRQLDCAFRYTWLTPAYVLNTDAMQYADWAKPGWTLDVGEYRVMARISGANVDPVNYWFRLTNPESGPLVMELERPQ